MNSHPPSTLGAALAGILLVNLGTPDAPTPRAVRRYLAEFLWDSRVIEAPRWLWWLALHGVILRIRPRRAAHAYQTVWGADGSPLLAIGHRQSAALKKELTGRFNMPIHVALGMRYGTPSVASALHTLRQAGITRFVVLPLYPQYSATTTASVFDAVAATLRTWRVVPEMHFVAHYYDHPAYIAALAGSVRAHWAVHGTSERLLMSFHGLPERYRKAGDPYAEECHATARHLACALELPDTAWQLVFQSRFGREAWLQPYADATLRQLAGQGVRRLDVICPGFAADCLETLEETALQNRDIFLRAGGEQYHYIPALNDAPAHIAALADLACAHLGLVRT